MPLLSSFSKRRNPLSFCRNTLSSTIIPFLPAEEEIEVVEEGERTRTGTRTGTGLGIRIVRMNKGGCGVVLDVSFTGKKAE